jgi:PAS domain S-box-containing protein
MLVGLAALLLVVVTVALVILSRKNRELNLARNSAESANTLFNQLAGQSRTVHWEVNAEGVYTYVSPVSYAVLGSRPEELVDRKHFYDLLHGDEREVKKTAAFEFFVRKEPFHDLEHIIQTNDGRLIWVSTNGFPVLDDHGAFRGYRGSDSDITERKRAEKQLQDTLENLRKAVGATIQVMVTAVETRDPYTAGHQIRSADLARAIAVEMRLPQKIIDGIRMAGSIHDIGKLSIPAEILSKPTKLSDLEFSLIKEHAKKGYEMLKDVESPWPLAEIVRQHHERMDGSGYPQMLKGEEILMEARILAVADVVESMASHRPYRPGLGVDAALDEIEQNRGLLYDNAVADACLKLFREKGYRLIS